ncbi:MAG: PAS domain S-box protein [Nitrospiraceae bacterium]|nr:PAS domain S-box protein [Nitrospiraceae bacterium]
MEPVTPPMKIATPQASHVRRRAAIRQAVHIFVVIAGILLIFGVDLVTPLGIAEWILYILPVWYASRLPGGSHRLLPLAVLLATVLTGLGFFLSPPSIAPWIAAANRAMGVVFLWGFALVVRRSAAKDDVLRENERRFRSVFNQQFQFMAVLSPDGVVLDINELPLRATGVSRESVMGRLFWETPWWKRLPAVQKDWPVRLAKAAGTDGPVLTQDLYHTADGALRTADAAVTAIRGADGRVEFFIMQATDVTDRKRAEETLRDSEERFRGTFDQAAVGIAQIAPDGRWLRVNRALCEIVGYSESELLHKTFQEITHPDDLDRDLAYAHKLLAGELSTYSIEKRYIRKDGGIVWINLTVSLIRDASARPKYFIAVVENITERKRIAEALRENENRLAVEAKALARLNEASSRLWRMASLSDGLEEMLAATIDLLGADMGNIQLLEGGILRIAVQRGFKQDFLDFFGEVSTEDDAACGRTLRTGKRTVIEDIETDPPYAPMRPVARAAGYRAVQSTPLMSRAGKPLGMVSTHFRSPHYPDVQDLRRLDLYVRQAADFIDRCRAEQALRESEQRFQTMADTPPRHAVDHRPRGALHLPEPRLVRIYRSNPKDRARLRLVRRRASR